MQCLTCNVLFLACLVYYKLMSWALKRQIAYIFLLVVFFSASGYLIAAPRLKKPVSCVDNKQNGDETGIDCGGSCARACISQVDEVSILWARAFRVIPGRYNAVAYIENHNKNAAINKINYRFRFADANNIYIGKREGSTFIPPAGKIAIFEPAIDIGNSIPIYTTFEFTQAPGWIQVPEAKITQSKILVSDIKLKDEASSPRLTLSIKNNSFLPANNLSVIAILYDANHNAISASRTFLDILKEEEVKELNFTWPEPFSSMAVVKEIIPMYNFWSK